MRAPGEIRCALLSAAQSLARVERDGTRHGPTIRELANYACVGYEAALHTVRNMARAGQLEIACERRVGYRNRPVAEYVPSAPADAEKADTGAGYVDLGQLMAVWK